MRNNIRKPMDTSRLTKIALIAGIYATVALPFAWISFGVFQLRVSEALTIMPIFESSAISGLSLGCVIANIYGYATGYTPVYDILIGSLATLLSAFLTRKCRHIRFKGWPVLSTIPPIIINAIVIGVEQSMAECGFKFIQAIWLKNIGSVMFGQFIACFVLGLPLFKLLEATVYRNKEID